MLNDPTPPSTSSNQLPSSGGNSFNGLWRGASWPIGRFYNALRRRFDSSQFAVVSMQLRKRFYFNIIPQEFVILDVVPLQAGTNIPQTNALHTYIEINRGVDEAQMSWLFFWWGPADDRVIILRKEDEVNIALDGLGGTQASQYRAGECLATVSWESVAFTGTPNLLDTFEVLNLLSLTYPNYNVLALRPCDWFPRAIYDILYGTYSLGEENTGDSVWKKAKFYIIRCLTPSPSTSFRRLFSCLSDCRDGY